MRCTTRLALFVCLAALSCLAWRRTVSTSDRSLVAQPQHDVARIVGRVWTESGPAAAARVRLKGHADFVLADEAGRFAFSGRPANGDVVTAAKDGYLITGAAASASPLEIRLPTLPSADSSDYEWVDPTPTSASSGACGNCHPHIYDEWRTSGHAQSAVNRRLQTLFDGAEWNLAREYPDGLGVCWSCHAPSLEPDADDFNLRSVTGVAAAGVHCDFCHKIRSTTVEQAGLTHGRFGYELLRPTEGQLFFGPLDDVDRGEDAYSALQTESRFCATCHEGVLFGVHVYGTWSEWLASPARRQGRQCQSCHMTPSGTLTNIAPTSGGIERHPASLASHTFLPGGREAMLRRAVNVSVAVDRDERGAKITVRLEARDIGHRLPTGFIDRQLLLVVEPFDADGNAAELVAGETLPDAAGRKLRGKAGRLFAKLLTDPEGHVPAPFWRAGVSMTDTRLTPERPETIGFIFSPATVVVRVRLIYRKFWQEVSDSKHWPDDDTTVHDETLRLTKTRKDAKERDSLSPLRLGRLA